MRPGRFSPSWVFTLFSVAAPLLVAGTAHGFCRAVTEPIPDSWDQNAACFTGSAGGGALQVYWKNACVSYDLQQNASRQAPLDKATAIADRAFAAWSNATCSNGGHPSISSHNLGPVECSAVQYNEDQPNQHVIIFRDDVWPYSGNPYNTLGLTRLKIDKTSGEIFDADMEINSADQKLITDGTPGPGEFLLESVLTHEAGHFLGLAHSTDPNAIMYATYKGDSPQLSPDDVEGICAIYPPDGTRVTQTGPVTQDMCDPTPRHGFSGSCGSPDGGSAATTEVDSVHRSGCSVAPGGSPGGAIPMTGLLALLMTRRRHRQTRPSLRK